MINPVNRNDRSNPTEAPRSASKPAPAASERSEENRVTTEENSEIPPAPNLLQATANHASNTNYEIEDADTAEKSVQFVRHFILHQPVQAMTAQANSNSKSALELLQ